MLRKAAICAALIAGGWILTSPASVSADDSAASIAAGGLVARRETRIVMAKEVLRISETKVVVDYDFRNDTDEDVTTEVAFPVPPYTDGVESPAVPLESYADFRLEVNGKPVRFEAQARATLGGKDVTGILTADGIDIADFGHYEAHPNGNDLIRDLARLPKKEQERLITLRLFDPDAQMANWTVHLQYHWTQTFPAHSTTHIRHEYTPNVGYEMMPLESIKQALLPPGLSNNGKGDQSVRYDLALLTSFCAERDFLRGLEHGVEAGGPEYGEYAYPQWVDFILTSANTWRRPIEDFTLIVERPRPAQGVAWDQTLISFCSPDNGKVEKIDANHFRVHLTNFVPTSELRIGFFGLPGPEPAKAPAKE